MACTRYGGYLSRDRLRCIGHAPVTGASFGILLFCRGIIACASPPRPRALADPSLRVHRTLNWYCLVGSTDELNTELLDSVQNIFFSQHYVGHPKWRAPSCDNALSGRAHRSPAATDRRRSCAGCRSHGRHASDDRQQHRPRRSAPRGRSRRTAYACIARTSRRDIVAAPHRRYGAAKPGWHSPPTRAAARPAAPAGLNSPAGATRPSALRAHVNQPNAPPPPGPVRGPRRIDTVLDTLSGTLWTAPAPCR